mmetsp:Transcript_2441/g.4581  ORF Transcript_2441/g.4581 Transcript_2441/m.4581 type:complete len:359 (+) Transcript_2441:140-1216(+)
MFGAIQRVISGENMDKEGQQEPSPEAPNNHNSMDRSDAPMPFATTSGNVAALVESDDNYDNNGDVDMGENSTAGSSISDVSAAKEYLQQQQQQQHNYNQDQQQNSSTQTFPPSLPSLQHPSRSSPAQPVEVGNMNGVLNDARNSSSTENASAFFNARTNPPHVPLPSAASVAPLVTNDADSTSVPYPQGQQQGVHANSGSTVRDSQTELSSELSRLFLSQNFSTDDGGALSQFHSTDISTVDLPGGDRNGGRQYYWLERFHEHLEQQHAEEQQQQQSSQSHSVPGIRRNVNTADAFPGPSSITDDYSERAVSRSMPTPTTSATDTPVSQTSNGTTPSTTTRPPARGTSLDATSTSSNI